MNKKKILLTALKFLISCLLIYWIIQGVDLGEIIEIITSVNLYILPVLLLLKFIGYYISAVRWRGLLKAQEGSASISFLITSYLVSFFFNNILPSSIGGDVIRVVDTVKSGTSRLTALTIIFVDRFLGVLALMMIVLLTLFIPSQITAQLPFSHGWILVSSAGMVGILWLIFMPSKRWTMALPEFKFPILQKFSALFQKIVESFLVFKRHRNILAQGFLLSLALQFNVVLYHYFLAKSLDLSIPFYSFFIVIPLYIFITMLPISINGIGVREGILVGLLSTLYGFVTRDQALAFSFMIYGITVIQGLFGGVVYALRK